MWGQKSVYMCLCVCACLYVGVCVYMQACVCARAHVFNPRGLPPGAWGQVALASFLPAWAWACGVCKSAFQWPPGGISLGRGLRPFLSVHLFLAEALGKLRSLSPLCHQCTARWGHTATHLFLKCPRLCLSGVVACLPENTGSPASLHWVARESVLAGGVGRSVQRGLPS